MGGRGVLRGRLPGVPMVQTTQARTGFHDRVRCRPFLDRASVRRVFFEGVVNTVIVVVVRVLADQPAEMLFVQGDDMVQDLAPNTPHPSFRDPILPGRLDTRPFWLQTRRLQKGQHLSIEFRIAVQNYVSVWRSFGKRFAQLLDDPVSSWVTGDVEMQDPSSPMLDDEEAVQQLERHRGHGEEVEGHDHLAVVLEKGQPSLAGITLAAHPAQIPSHGSFRYFETELLELAVDFRCAPAHILFCHRRMRSRISPVIVGRPPRGLDRQRQ